MQGETRPVLEGEAEGLHLVRARYVIVHDLEVRSTYYNGINSDDGGDYANSQAAQYQIFRNLYIHWVGGMDNEDCLKLSGVNHYYVLNSEFTVCGGLGSGSGLDQVGCHQGLIAGNYFHDISGNAVQTKGGSRGHRHPGEPHAKLRGAGDQHRRFNRFRVLPPPLIHQPAQFRRRDIRVIANLIEGSVTPLAFVGAVDSLAADNTLVDPTNWLMRILQETITSGDYEFLACGNNSVVNNLFYFNRDDLNTYQDINIGPNTDPDTFIFSHNLWYAHDDPAHSQPDLPVAETSGMVGQDPLLLNPASGNYHLHNGSPAIHSGTQVAGVSFDYDGSLYNIPPSIGAFEGSPLVLSNLLLTCVRVAPHYLYQKHTNIRIMCFPPRHPTQTPPQGEKLHDPQPDQQK